jgi:hypothetical protein
MRAEIVCAAFGAVVKCRTKFWLLLQLFQTLARFQPPLPTLKLTSYFELSDDDVLQRKTILPYDDSGFHDVTVGKAGGVMSHDGVAPLNTQPDSPPLFVAFTRMYRAPEPPVNV